MTELDLKNIFKMFLCRNDTEFCISTRKKERVKE